MQITINLNQQGGFTLDVKPPAAMYTPSSVAESVPAIGQLATDIVNFDGGAAPGDIVEGGIQTLPQMLPESEMLDGGAAPDIALPTAHVPSAISVMTDFHNLDGGTAPGPAGTNDASSS